MDDVLEDGGIMKEVVQPGDGPPVPQNASVLSISAYLFYKFLSPTWVYRRIGLFSRNLSSFSFLQVHYSGFLEYSDQPFETTTRLKYPRMLKLGRGQ